MSFQSPLCAQADTFQLALPSTVPGTATAVAPLSASQMPIVAGTGASEWAGICSKLESAISALQKMQIGLKQITFSASQSANPVFRGFVDSQIISLGTENKIAKAIETLQHVQATKHWEGNPVPPSMNEIKGKVVEFYKASKAVEFSIHVCLIFIYIVTSPGMEECSGCGCPGFKAVRSLIYCFLFFVSLSLFCIGNQ